jgi:hypothetical protein
MSTSGIFHRVGPDPTLAIAPNAAQPGTPAAGQDVDAAVAAQFSAALASLLAQTPATEADDPMLSGTPAGDVAQQSLIAALVTPAPVTLQPSPQPDAAAAVDPKAAHRALDLVAPELRARLERVIDRMESEFGYKVEVVETYRSQARQNALFAQGRTEPGQVVTWTRASNHTLGRAADLVIDGSYDDPVAYQRLMRVAREEGLRTLGPRDPGHVELAASQSSIVPGGLELERPTPPADPAQPVGGQVAVVAPVARVATVYPIARVATVAQVAQVATVGAQAAPVVHSSPRAPRTEPAVARSAAARRDGSAIAGKTGGAEQPSPVAGPSLAAMSTSADTDSHAKDGRFAEPNDERASRSQIGQAAARHDASEILAKAREELMRAVAGTDSASGTASPVGTRETTTTGIGHADASERIARVLKMQEAASDRPLSQVVLRLERPDGGEDRLRVDLRGNTVSATLDVGDQAAADRLNANVKELQRTLERHGFETDSLTVRTATRSIEASTMARGVGASVEADLQRTTGSSSSSNTNTSSRERGARHDEQRPSPDSQRHRSRREHKGGRS